MDSLELIKLTALMEPTEGIPEVKIGLIDVSCAPLAHAQPRGDGAFGGSSVDARTDCSSAKLDPATGQGCIGVYAKGAFKITIL